MYDLIIRRRFNKKKLIFVLALLLIIAVIISYSVTKIDKVKKQKEAEKLQKQEELRIEQEKLAAQKAEEEKIEKAKQEKLKKVTTPLTEEQQNNILHIYRSTGEKRVFLTFDDGPSESVTPLILNTLKEQNVKATFFVLGGNAKRYPKLVKRAYEEGHYIANHGYSHKYSSVYSSPEATLEEYNSTEQAIRDALGIANYSSHLFRFPGGSNGGYYDEAKQNSKALLRENGVVHLDWNCLSKDAEGAKTKEELLQNIKDTMGEKESLVILMHDSSDKILTYEMLTELITMLKEKGYKFENIYDLL